MKNRPWPLNLIAISFILIVLSLPVQAIMVFESSVNEIFVSMRNITDLNLLIMGVLLFQIPLLLKARRVLIFTLPFCAGLITFNNYLVGSSELTVDAGTTMLASVGFLSLVGFMVHPKVVTCIRHPQKRWWLQKSRTRVNLPMKLKYFRGTVDRLKTFDISETGAFLTGVDEFDSLDDIDIGTEINFKIISDDLIYIRSVARVVRKADANGEYPKGIGVEFLSLSKEQKDVVKIFCDA